MEHTEPENILRTIGTFITHRNYGDDREIKVKYDRKNFYPTTILKVKNFPTNTEIPKDRKCDGYINVLTMNILAVRKDNKRGIFMDSQREFIMFDGLVIFESEFRKIVKKEFDIKFLEITKTEKIPTYCISDSFQEYLTNMIATKEELRETNPNMYNVVKQQLNLNVGMSGKEPNGIFDGFSLAYLKSVTRLEMYRALDKYDDVIIESFIDSISCSNEIPELEKDNHWRIEKKF